MGVPREYYLRKMDERAERRNLINRQCRRGRYTTDEAFYCFTSYVPAFVAEKTSRAIALRIKRKSKKNPGRDYAAICWLPLSQIQMEVVGHAMGNQPVTQYKIAAWLYNQKIKEGFIFPNY